MLIVMIEAVTTDEGEAGRLIEAARAMIVETRTEPGCLCYAFAQDVIDPAIVRVSERWRDSGAMAAHMKSPHLARFMEILPQIGLRAMTAKVYDASGERDLFPAA